MDAISSKLSVPSFSERWGGVEIPRVLAVPATARRCTGRRTEERKKLRIEAIFQIIQVLNSPVDVLNSERWPHSNEESNQQS